jgi:hypothetical protein
VAAARAEIVAEKLRAALSQPYILGADDTEYFGTASIGVTLFGGQTEPAEILMKQADMALYQAKDAGRNAICFFNPAMQAAQALGGQFAQSRVGTIHQRKCPAVPTAGFPVRAWLRGLSGILVRQTDADRRVRAHPMSRAYRRQTTGSKCRSPIRRHRGESRDWKEDSA